MAMELLETIIQLAGIPFEHDRQGENMKVLYISEETEIDGIKYRAGDVVVTHFDPGAMYMESVDETEMSLLAEVIVQVVSSFASLGNRDLLSTFLEQLRVLSVNNSDSHYLAAQFRAILARSDIRRHISNPDFLSTIFQSVIAGGKVNPALISALLAKAQTSGVDIAALARLLSSDLQSGGNIRVVSYSDGLKVA